MLSAAAVVFVCAMPMVLYADASGDTGTEERVLFKVSGEELADKHVQEVEVSFKAERVPSGVIIAPSATPTVVPVVIPTTAPTVVPVVIPTKEPVTVPTEEPVRIPTKDPVSIPTAGPVREPTVVPVTIPTLVPTAVPTDIPEKVPSLIPTEKPDKNPTPVPTIIRSTTTIVKPVVTITPEYIPVPFITRVPAPYESRTPVPTVIVLPGSGYTGGTGIIVPGITATPVPDRSGGKQEVKKEEAETELVPVPMATKQAMKEEGSDGLRISGLRIEGEDQTDEAGKGPVTVVGSVYTRLSEDEEESGGGWLVNLKWTLVFSGLAILILIILIYLLGIYMGWWMWPQLSFHMKSDEDFETEDSIGEPTEEIDDWGEDDQEKGRERMQEAGNGSEGDENSET